MYLDDRRLCDEVVQRRESEIPRPNNGLAMDK